MSSSINFSGKDAQGRESDGALGVDCVGHMMRGDSTLEDLKIYKTPSWRKLGSDLGWGHLFGQDFYIVNIVLLSPLARLKQGTQIQSFGNLSSKFEKR